MTRQYHSEFSQPVQKPPINTKSKSKDSGKPKDLWSGMIARQPKSSEDFSVEEI